MRQNLTTNDLAAAREIKHQMLFHRRAPDFTELGVYLLTKDFFLGVLRASAVQ
jgi:hypothetical protein